MNAEEARELTDKAIQEYEAQSQDMARRVAEARETFGKNTPPIALEQARLLQLEEAISQAVTAERELLDPIIEEEASARSEFVQYAYGHSASGDQRPFLYEVGKIVASRLIEGLHEDGFNAQVLDEYSIQTDGLHSTTKYTSELRIEW